MQLYCVRHGHAQSTSDEAASEWGPGLSEAGRLEVSKMATFLAENHVVVSHLMHSELSRAQQTAEILAETVTKAPVMESSAWLTENGPIYSLVDQIQGWADDTMLVGHMPAMSELVSLLVTGQPQTPLLRLPPATVVCLQNDEQRRWVINWVLRPDMIVPSRS